MKKLLSFLIAIAITATSFSQARYMYFSNGPTRGHATDVLYTVFDSSLNMYVIFDCALDSLPLKETNIAGLITDLAAKQPLIATGTTNQYFDAQFGLHTIISNTNQLTNGSGFITLAGLSSGTAISYNNVTGQINNLAPDQTVAISGTTNVSVTGTYPNFTVTDLAPAKVWVGTTLRNAAIQYVGSATVASGVAVYQLTTDGTSTGTAIFPNGPITGSVQPVVNDGTAAYQCQSVWSNSNKTLTITANKLTTSNILTGILGQAAANGAVVNITVLGY